MSAMSDSPLDLASSAQMLKRALEKIAAQEAMIALLMGVMKEADLYASEGWNRMEFVDAIDAAKADPLIAGRMGK